MTAWVSVSLQLCVEFVFGRIVNAEVDAGLGELLGHVVKSRTPPSHETEIRNPGCPSQLGNRRQGTQTLCPQFSSSHRRDEVPPPSRVVCAREALRTEAGTEEH